MTTRTALGGLSNNLSKLVINEIPLYYFLSIRYLGMMILNYAVSSNKIKKDIKTISKDKIIIKSLLLSSLLSAMGTIFFYIGLKELPITMVSVLDNSFHMIFVVLLGIILKKQKHSTKFYILFIMLLPAMYLVLFPNLNINFSFSLIGIIMLMLNGLVGAIEVHLTKEQLKKIEVQTNVLFKTVFSLFVSVTCIFIFENKIEDLIKNMTIILFIFILYNIVNSYIIKYLHTSSIKELGTEITTIFTSLTPIFSIIFAVIIFKEKITLTQIFGILLTILILYLIKKDKEKNINKKSIEKREA